MMFFKALNAMPKEFVGQVTLLPAMLETFDLLIEQGKTKEVTAKLEAWEKALTKTTYDYFFVGLKLAALYERSIGPTIRPSQL